MSISKEQFFKNSAWTFLELTLFPILMIIATPVFIKNLGIEQYGLWMLVTTITLGINVLNVGVGDTNIRLISKYRAEGNLNLIRKVYQHNFSLSLFLCLIALLVGALFYFTNFISLFYKTSDYHFANSILFLACFSTGIKFVEISILSVFKAFERFDLNSKLVLVSKNSVILINLLLVTLNYNLVEIFAFTIVINLLNIILQLLVLNAYERKIIVAPSLTFLKEKLDFVNYNFWYWAQSSIALMGFLADKLVVAWFTDVKTLGYYSIASLIGTHIHNFFLAFGSFIFPRVSFKLATNTGIAPLYFVSRSLIALPGWLLIGFLIVSGDWVFKLWLGNETFVNSIYYIKLYLVFEAAMLLIIVPFYFINGTQQIKLNSLFEMVIRCTHFISIFIGYYLGGVSGIIYGLIFSTFLNIPFQYFYFHQKVIKSAGSFNYLLILVPVVFLFGLMISGNVFFQVSLILGLVLCSKFIYFDPARKYSKDILLFRNILK